MPMSNPTQSHLNARGARLLITIDFRSRYVSSRQLKANWPEAEHKSTTITTVDPQGLEHEVTIGHKIQNATTRVQQQHRYPLLGAGALFDALDPPTTSGEPDIVGIGRAKDGSYTIEANTQEVRDFHEAWRVGTRNGVQRKASTAAPPGASNAQGKPEMAEKEAATAGENKSKKRPSQQQQEEAAEGGDDGAAAPPAKRPRGRPAKPRRSGLRFGAYGSDELMGSYPKKFAKRKDTAWNGNGGDEKDDKAPIDTFTQPIDAPMGLLPGETPLKIELYFGEGRLYQEDGSLPPRLAAAPGAAIQPMLRYSAAVSRARAGMAAHAREAGGEALEKRAVEASIAFEQLCLDEEQATAEEREQACKEYDAVLRRVYGPELVLYPHCLDAALLETEEGQEDLQLLRVMERRFIIWRQGDTACSPSTAEPAAARTSSGLFNVFGNLFSRRSASGSLASHAETHAAADAPSARWDDRLQAIWGAFTSRLAGKEYSVMGLDKTENGVSCALHDTLWMNGLLVRNPVGDKEVVMAAVEGSQLGHRTGRLYLTDGSLPDYQARGYPDNAPGMPCNVDAMANAMFPHAVRSCRATNLFHFLKSESTGTGTFTLFCPLGRGANLTAFHFETKRRRSYNCATGDYIVQPLATAAASRAVMRVHAAATGRHSRHGQLLPLECYLEEGIPMVTCVRSGAESTLCELCEQSMHAFVTFADITTAPLPLKVSCNDFDLIWEVDAAYFLEALSVAYGRLGMLREEAPPPDHADRWIQSSYLLTEPCTAAQAAEAGTEKRPWKCELRRAAEEGAGASTAAAVNGEERGGDEGIDYVHDAAMAPGMDVVAVRTAEKLLDVLAGVLTKDGVQPWVGEVPSRREAKAALHRLGPVLLDMQRRAFSETTDSQPEEEQGEGEVQQVAGEALAALEGGFGSGEADLDNYGKDIFVEAEEEDRDCCHFSLEYMQALQRCVEAAGVAVEELQFGDTSAVAFGAMSALELRAAWLQLLREERVAAAARPVDLAALAAARERRGAAEIAFDATCCELAARRGRAEGADPEEEELAVD